MGWFDDNQPPADQYFDPSQRSANTGINGGRPPVDYGNVTFRDGPGAQDGRTIGITDPSVHNPQQGIDKFPTGAPPPAGSPTPAAGGNPMDRDWVQQQILQKAREMQAAGQYVNPSVFNDPGYWADRAIEKGGWVNNGPDANNIGYFSDRFGQREGAPAGQGGGGGYGHYSLSGSVGPGAGAGGFTQPFQGLSLDQLRQTPGYQFALEQGQKAITGSAAARGSLLTGGTLKNLASFGTGLADQTFGQAYDRGRNEYLDAYNIDRNNRNDISNRYYNLSSFGLTNPGGSLP